MMASHANAFVQTIRTGRIVRFHESSGEIDVRGDSNHPATFELEDGKIATGRQLLYRKGAGILEAEDVTFEIP